MEPVEQIDAFEEAFLRRMIVTAECLDTSNQVMELNKEVIADLEKLVNHSSAN